MKEQFPDDKSTVISIVPFELNETKPGLYPGNFIIPKCVDGKEPVAVTIGASDYLMAVGGQKQPVRIVTPSYQIAQSIVNDFLDGQLYTDDGCKPGICWVPGEVTVAEFKLKYSAKYQLICTVQKNWFVRLVRETDTLWKKYGHTRVVSDQARFAARFLNIALPDWMSIETITESHAPCPACGLRNDPGIAVCTNCRCVLDEAKFKTLKFAS